MRGIHNCVSFILCFAAFCIGINVHAYSIPFSFSNSAEMVNKVCLSPCREIGLEKGTKVTVDFTLSTANTGAEGEHIPHCTPCRRFYIVPSDLSKPVFFVVFTLNQYIDQHVDASTSRTSDLCRVIFYCTLLPPSF
jgi:hypothetical protein